ncbi:hypothetical protein HPB48_004353 [Haemaphysalis longicornis]|uniref:Uncharacterized protein n=1 Tax=Haemaphysalis longicornis TaxID=44386 RepID=A0A9J6FRK2_HAELO|nr:hypothetical protein HPB48_004353 [Haemaphysalis longicornis]
MLAFKASCPTSIVSVLCCHHELTDASGTRNVIVSTYLGDNSIRPVRACVWQSAGSAQRRRTKRRTRSPRDGHDSSHSPGCCRRMGEGVEPGLPDIASFVRALVHGDGGVHGRKGARELQRQASGRQTRHVRHWSPRADASSRARHGRQAPQQSTATRRAQHAGTRAGGEPKKAALITASASSRPAGPARRRPWGRNPCRPRRYPEANTARGGRSRKSVLASRVHRAHENAARASAGANEDAKAFRRDDTPREREYAFALSPLQGPSSLQARGGPPPHRRFSCAAGELCGFASLRRSSSCSRAAAPFPLVSLSATAMLGSVALHCLAGATLTE